MYGTIKRFLSDAYLALHVHDDDRVGTVTHDELFDVPRQRVYAVNGDVAARGAT